MDQELKKEFQKLNTRLEKLDTRFDGMEATVNRVALQVVNLTEDTAAIREAMPSKELINKLYGVADALAQEVEGYREEQTATSHRQDQTENWIKQAAPLTGVQFEQ